MHGYFEHQGMVLPSSLVLLLLSICFVLLASQARANPRSHTLQLNCGTQLEQNRTAFALNFAATMENISNQIQSSHFGVSIAGKSPDASFSLAQCYGDLSQVDCILCYAEARTVLPQCFPYNFGRVFLDGCFMRAANYSFFDEYSGFLDTSLCGNKTKKDNLFVSTARQAIASSTAFAVENEGYGRAALSLAGSTNESVYVLANCWSSLTTNSCRACLENASAAIEKCLPWEDGRVLNTGCFLMYSDTDFLNPEPRGRSKAGIIVISVAVSSSVIVIIVGVAICVYLFKRRSIQKKRKDSNEVAKLASLLLDKSLNFKYTTLDKATESFKETNKIGQGGFGSVYKGVLPDGREIAVKRLFLNRKHKAADFYNEVNLISSVQHKNLVRLLGCSCSGPESLLVYEFMPNRGLDHFIFDQTRGKELNWGMRFQIIIGAVEGLVYLHENQTSKIIHRDIKASNILLDSKFQAKIADFGLARSFQEDKTHISTAIAGTLGYMAPEYLAHGQLTEKADIYSLGVLLIEIITGKQNNKARDTEYGDGLVNEVWRHFQDGTIANMMDPNLLMHDLQRKDDIRREIQRVVHVALLCTQENYTLRPSTSQLLLMLQRKETELPNPTNPPFADESNIELSDTTEDPEQPLKTSLYTVAAFSYSSFHPR